MAQRASYKRVLAAVEQVNKRYDLPGEWLKLQGSYEWWQLQLYYVDEKEGLTTAINHLYTGTIGECWRVLLDVLGESVYLPKDGHGFKASLEYQIKRNFERLAVFNSKQ